MTARSMFQSPFLIGFRSGCCSLRNKVNSIRTIAAALAMFWILPSAAADEDRVALILSAQDYTNYGKSEINADTLGKMGAALKGQGFRIDVVTNANNSTSRAKLRDFAKKAKNARVAIVVLAGHGVGSGGRAYFYR